MIDEPARLAAAAAAVLFLFGFVVFIRPRPGFDDPLRTLRAGGRSDRAEGAVRPAPRVLLDLPEREGGCGGGTRHEPPRVFGGFWRQVVRFLSRPSAVAVAVERELVNGSLPPLIAVFYFCTWLHENEYSDGTRT